MTKVTPEISELAKKAALLAGEILMDNFGRVREVSEKPDGSLVTNVDIEADREIVALIRKKFPGHSILTEESPEVKGDSDYSWIIDPIDGTHNYARGIDLFGISICVTHMKEAVVGIIYLPASKQLYHCKKGCGAYLNGKKIQVSKKKLRDACISHDSTFRRDTERMLEGLSKLINSVFNIRMLGCTVRNLAHVAEGKLDAEIEYNDKPWDFYAGALLIEEAGGKVTDFNGGPWHLSEGTYIASNGIIHEEILKLLSGPE